MIDRQALLGDLRRQLRLLERDLAERAESVPEMAAALEAEYRAARAAERTAATFNVWRAGELTQAAVAWLLACVFVRFIEDNGLIDEPLIGGPDGGNERAAHRQTRYFREHPTDTDRDYLLDGFDAVARLPAMAPLYDRERNPVWRLGISGDAARDLLAFWRTTAPDTGALRHDFADPAWDTRFLGDLYQDLSDDAKKRYALLQTPEFVEEFILDRTLTPALDEFGLADTRLIDPACGSGHFLLGAFGRLLRQWFNREPGTGERALVQRALDAVYGVDINPFAAAIARFRLLLAALRASGITRLQDAPAFRINVAAGDSLLHGRRFGELDLGSGAEQHDLSRQAEFSHAFQAEDLDALNRILGQQYHVVVGNPPYITPKDSAVRQLYRSRYATCYMKYAMSVPFTERCFGLALRGTGTQSAGHLGIITANSFMKREFGKKLIESYLPSVDLTHVIDTSGAYIPGHGTPTVIIFGRNRAPISDAVRVVMGRRGEPTPPAQPEDGRVWRSILTFVDRSGGGNEWLDVADLPRVTFASHPWSVSDTLANDLKLLLDRNKNLLESVATSIGPASFTGTDDAFVAPKGMFRRLGVDPELIRSYVVGELIRDWSYEGTSAALVPYNNDNRPFAYDVESPWGRFLWRNRTTIGSKKSFGGKTRLECGDDWWTWDRWIPERYADPRFIAFAFVSTHNHFMFDRGGNVFSRSAPVIKLPADATEADHLALVGILNSSVSCFWMKQMFHNKGSTVDAHGARQTTDEFENFFEYTGTGLKQFPLPTERQSDIAGVLDRLSTERQARLPEQLTDRFPIRPAELEAHQDSAAELHARMIALQEELDWECYRLYGIIDEDCRYANGAEPPPLALGERAFEIVMARRMAAGELETRWFERHGSTPITDLPAHWPDDYRALVARRIELIESDRFIGLLERPEYKRRWNVESWRDEERRALRTWLLDRLESPAYWPEPRLTTVRELAGRAAADADFQQVAARLSEGAHGDLDPLIAELVAAESVPALPAQRYKPSGLAKRVDWEEVWQRQRREDEIDAQTAAATPREPNETADDYAARLKAEQRRRKRDELGDLAPPPKYRSADFLKPGYWRLRGALDVPKERFVSFPDMSRDHDPTLLVGWAGWDAPTLCRAVATYYTHAHEREGWSAARLTPLLAVIREYLPWLKQWHNDIDPEYNERLGDFYETFVQSQLAHFGLAQDDLQQWAPAGRS